MQRSIAKLILLATPENPLAFLAYSRASIEIAATLRQYIADKESAGESASAIEARLRASITVISIGAATSHWPDGPAYIHLGSEHDPISNLSGVHAKRPRGAGKDAVFLTTGAKVYGGGDGGENHNFSSLTSQYLSVIMLANKTTASDASMTLLARRRLSRRMGLLGRSRALAAPFFLLSLAECRICSRASCPQVGVSLSSLELAALWLLHS